MDNYCTCICLLIKAFANQRGGWLGGEEKFNKAYWEETSI